MTDRSRVQRPKDRFVPELALAPRCARRRLWRRVSTVPFMAIFGTVLVYHLLSDNIRTNPQFLYSRMRHGDRVLPMTRELII